MKVSFLLMRGKNLVWILPDSSPLDIYPCTHLWLFRWLGLNGTDQFAWQRLAKCSPSPFAGHTARRQLPALLLDVAMCPSSGQWNVTEMITPSMPSPYNLPHLVLHMLSSFCCGHVLKMEAGSLNGCLGQSISPSHGPIESLLGLLHCIVTLSDAEQNLHCSLNIHVDWTSFRRINLILFNSCIAFHCVGVSKCIKWIHSWWALDVSNSLI